MNLRAYLKKVTCIQIVYIVGFTDNNSLEGPNLQLKWFSVLEIENTASYKENS